MESVGNLQPSSSAQPSSIVKHSVGSIKYAHRVGREQLTVLHFNLSVANLKWFHKNFGYQDGTTHYREVSVLRLLPHRLKQSAVRLYPFHTVYETVGINVDQARRRED